MLKEAAEVPERILVWNEVDAKLSAPPVELLNVTGCECAGLLPDRFVSAISERVFGVKLEFVDLEIGEEFDELQQCFQGWHSTPRNVEHDAAPRKVGPIANRQLRKSRSIFAKKLSQRGQACVQALHLAKFDEHSRRINFEEVTFWMIRRGVGAIQRNRRIA